MPSWYLGGPSTYEEVHKLFHSECKSCDEAERTSQTELCLFCQHFRLRHLINCSKDTLYVLIRHECNVQGLLDRSSTSRLCRLLHSAIHNQLSLFHGSTEGNFNTRPLWLSPRPAYSSKRNLKHDGEKILMWNLEHDGTEGNALVPTLYSGLLAIETSTKPVKPSAYIDWPKLIAWPVVGANVATGVAREPQRHAAKHQFRVIDVEKDCIVSAPEACEYVTLSYVWGADSSNPVKSTSKNIQDLREPGMLRSYPLPRTLSDAMKTCIELGYQYLWIDALCIVQDNMKDKAIQVRQMDRIYRDAALCIIAAAGEDSDYGLPGVSQPRRWISELSEIHGMRLEA